MSAHTILIHAPPSAIWAAWEAVADWPVWDSEVRAASLPDGLSVGTAGWLQPKDGPRASIMVTGRTGHGFAVESRLPACRMVFDHALEAAGAATQVTHAVRFEGPLAPLFRLLIGRAISAGLPATLAGLKRHVEAGGA